MDTEATPDLQVIYSPVRHEFQLLTRFLQEEFCPVEPFIFQILQHIAKFRGKQMRPGLLFFARRLGADGVIGRESDTLDDAIKIGAVVELIHTATLVHDDILDDAKLRRNVETVHRHWGERAAVLIGDFIYSRAFHLSTQVPGMAGILSDTTHTICEGELLQIGNRFRPDLDEVTYMEIIRKKTAILYAVSCELGGMLGGLDAARCARLREFGLQLGMAFQIVDDCLDYSGKEAVAGKSLGTDLHQGKVTLPLIYLMECLSAEEGAWLRETLHTPLDSASEARIHKLVHQHGVVAEAFSRAEAFVEAAKKILSEVLDGHPAGEDPTGDPPIDNAIRESLELVSDYMIRRQR
jgi:octaprenyl-diphosphate synthase